MHRHLHKLYLFVISILLSNPAFGQPQLEEIFNLDGSDADRFFASLRADDVIYFAGQTSSPDFPVTSPVQAAFGGDDDDSEPGDMIVVKFNAATETIEWATYFGGSGSDAATGLSLDGSGNLVVSGWTTSTDFPTMNPIQPAHGGLSDGVILRISPSGELLFSTYLGGSDADQFSDTARDSTNESTIFCGFTASVDFPVPESNPDTADTNKPEAGNADYIVLALGDDNSLKWVTIPDTHRNFSANEVANAVAVDNGGTILVTGYAESSNFINNTLFGSHSGGRDLFLAKINGANADRQDSVLYGGSGDDAGNDVIIGFNGVAVVVGQTSSTDLSSPLFQPTYGGGDSDALLATFNYGSFRMSRVGGYFGGSGNDFARTAFLDPNGNVHVGGATTSEDLPFDRISDNDPAQATYGGGGFDSFLLRMNAGLSFGSPSMNLRHASYFGGPGEETITSLHLSPYVDPPAGNFDPYAVAFAGFGAPPEALQSVRADAIPVRTSESAPKAVRAQYHAARESGNLPDLEIEIKPRDPLVHLAEEEVVLVVTNKGEAPAIEIEIYLEAEQLISGDLTVEILNAFFEGAVLPTDEEPGEYQLPGSVFLNPGQSIEVTVLLRSLGGALLADQPGVGFTAEADPLGPDANPDDNTKSFLIPVQTSPDISVELVEATQDEPGADPRTASFTYRIANLGSRAADNLEVLVSGLNLRNVSYEFIGQPAQPLADLNGTAEVTIPAGTLEPAQETLLTIRGELAEPVNQGSSTTARTSHPGDSNTENNSATGENEGKIYDYAVSVIGNVIHYARPVDGQSDLLHETEIEIKLTIPEDYPLEGIESAVVTIQHNGNISSLSTSPPEIGQCNGLGETTMECRFSPSEFFEPDSFLPPGTIRLRLTDNLGMGPFADLINMTFSLVGDGDPANLPNNYAEAPQDMTRKGVLSLTRVSNNAVTIKLEDGSIGVVVTQVVRVRNDGPGTVNDIQLMLLERDNHAHIGGRIFEPARIISDGSPGATVTTNSAEETVEIPSLEPDAEVVVEVTDLLPLVATGTGEVLDGGSVLGLMSLITAGGDDLTDLSLFVDVDDRLNFIPDNTLSYQNEESPDMAVTIESQRIEVSTEDGQRIPFLVTEILVSNIGAAPVIDGNLELNQTGVVPGGIIRRPPNLFHVAYTQPGLPDDPLRRLIEVGNIDPGASVKFLLRDEIASPGSDLVCALSGDVTHNSYDANVLNNSIERNFEYDPFYQTLDYGVEFLIQTRETIFLDGFRVPIVRTRLEFTVTGDGETENLPPFRLLFSHPGASEQVRLVPKDPSIPVPGSGLQCQSISDFLTECQFSAETARNFLVEFIDRVSSPTEQSVLRSRADIEGDGEVPSGDNNNRVESTLDYNPEPAADIRVTAAPRSGEAPTLHYKDTVTNQFIIENLSQDATARAVEVTIAYEYTPPLPEGSPVLVVVEKVGGDLSSEAAACLVSGNAGGCSIGDIEPGGQRVLSITSAFTGLPSDEDEYPILAGVRVKAQAVGELSLNNNQALDINNTSIPDFIFIDTGVEGDQFRFSTLILRPKALGLKGELILEHAPAIEGPWTPVEGDSVDATESSQFVRGRIDSGE